MTRAAALVATDVVVPGRLQVERLALSPGVTVVVGENGAGKSTLLDVLAGVLRPSRGCVALDDAALASLSPAERARRVASLGQQGGDLVDDITVAERIAQGLVPRRGPGAGWDDVVAGVVARVADELGIGGLLHRPLRGLSGGERRRAGIARALVDDAAAVLLLDEPFAGLDRQGTALVVEALRRRAAAGVVVVVSVHDGGTALALGGRLLALHQGRVVVDGALPDALAAASMAWGDVRVVVDGDWYGVLMRRRSDGV